MNFFSHLNEKIKELRKTKKGNALFKLILWMLFLLLVIIFLKSAKAIEKKSQLNMVEKENTTY